MRCTQRIGGNFALHSGVITPEFLLEFIMLDASAIVVITYILLLKEYGDSFIDANPAPTEQACIEWTNLQYEVDEATDALDKREYAALTRLCS